MLIHLVIQIYQVLALFPFAVFLAVFILGYIWTRDRQKSVRLAMDATTLFLVGSVSFTFNKVFHTNLGFWILLLISLISIGLLGGYQTRIKGKVQIVKIAKFQFRVGFLLLSVTYVILVALGIGQTIANS